LTSRNRGFTLLEVLISASLLLLLLGLLFTFLVPTMKASVRGSVRVEMQQMAVLALNKMVGDLQNTTAAGLSLSQRNPVSIGIVRIEGVTSEGMQIWEKNMIVYALLDGVLIRKVYPPGPPSIDLNLNGTTPRRVAAANLVTIAKEINGKETIVAKWVKSLRITTAGDNLAENPGDPGPTDFTIQDPVTVTIELERKESHQPDPEKFRLTRVVSMKQRL
jgi:prepilin-type N-terminal cleavage/methylation domain-containing protein